jgi:hypothetical protein
MAGRVDVWPDMRLMGRGTSGDAEGMIAVEALIDGLSGAAIVVCWEGRQPQYLSTVSRGGGGANIFLL